MTATTAAKTEYFYQVAVPVYLTQNIFSEKELTNAEVLKEAVEMGDWFTEDMNEWAEDVIATSPEKVEIEVDIVPM